ncbi:redoxin domain-containing protein [Mariniluteicoccus flavus]
MIEPFEGTNQYGQQTAIPGDSWWLLFFYPYAFTGICSSELRALRDLRPQFEELGCRIAAISCDAMFSLRVFADTESFGCNLITDHWPHGEIARRFGVFDEQTGAAVRGSFLIDPSGTVRWTTVNNVGTGRDIPDHLDQMKRLRGEDGDRWED